VDGQTPYARELGTRKGKGAKKLPAIVGKSKTEKSVKENCKTKRPRYQDKPAVGWSSGETVTGQLKTSTEKERGVGAGPNPTPAGKKRGPLVSLEKPMGKKSKKSRRERGETSFFR